MKKININKKSFSALIILFAMVTGTVIQSCQTETEDSYFIEPEKKVALDNFESLIEKTAPKLQRIVDKRDELINTKSVSSKKELQNLDMRVKNELSPLVDGSKAFLIDYADLSESDLIEISDGENEEIFAMLSMALLSIERENQSIASTNNQEITLKSLFTMQTANAELDWATVGGCASQAIGLDIFVDLKQAVAGKNLTRKVLKKAFIKVGKKLAGYATGAGIAITATYFVGCLAYNYF